MWRRNSYIFACFSIICNKTISLHLFVFLPHIYFQPPKSHQPKFTQKIIQSKKLISEYSFPLRFPADHGGAASAGFTAEFPASIRTWVPRRRIPTGSWIMVWLRTFLCQAVSFRLLTRPVSLGRIVHLPVRPLPGTVSPFLVTKFIFLLQLGFPCCWMRIGNQCFLFIYLFGDYPIYFNTVLFES